MQLRPLIKAKIPFDDVQIEAIAVIEIIAVPLRLYNSPITSLAKELKPCGTKLWTISTKKASVIGVYWIIVSHSIVKGNMVKIRK